MQLTGARSAAAAAAVAPPLAPRLAAAAAPLLVQRAPGALMRAAPAAAAAATSSLEQKCTVALVKNIVGTGVLTLPAGIAKLNEGGASSDEALMLAALITVATCVA